MNFSYCSWTVLVWLPLVVSCFQFSWSLRRDTLAARSLRGSRQKLTHYYKCQWRTKMRSMLQWLQAGETWEDGTRGKKPQVDFCLWAKPTMRAEPLKCSNRKNTFGGHEKCVDTPLQPHHFLHSSNLKGKQDFMANKSLQKVEFCNITSEASYVFR